MKLIGISGKKGSGKDTVGSILQFLLDPTIPEVSKTDFNYYTYYCATNINMGRCPIKIIKFADKLKNIVSVLLDCTVEELEDEVFKETPLGSEWTVWSHYYSGKEVFETKEDAIIAFREYYQDNYNDAAIVDESDITKIEISPRFIMQSLGTDWGRSMINPNIWVNSTLSQMRKGRTYIATDVRFRNEFEAVKYKKGVNIRVERKSKKPLDLHSSEMDLDNMESEFDYVIYNDGTKEDLFKQVYTAVYPYLILDF